MMPARFAALLVVVTLPLLGFMEFAAGISGIAEVQAAPADDLRAFRRYYRQRFPTIEFEAFADGIYALDANHREEWEQMEEFPPYEFDLDAGETLFHTQFADGRSFADCFPDYASGIRQRYPYWDRVRGEVVTLEWAINLCREQHGEPPLPYGRGALAQISAYLAFLSRGRITDVEIPADDPVALAAYEDGKRFFYSRRGQLNFSCASCHVIAPGLRLRANLLSPAIGQTSHFPAHRKQWGELGTLHRRYRGCSRQVRDAGFALQSRTYRNLEYFQTYMSNGIPLNGPGSRQ